MKGIAILSLYGIAVFFGFAAVSIGFDILRKLVQTLIG